MKKINVKKGFTLVELMAVLVILGILAVILYPKIKGIIDSSTAKTNLESIQNIEKVAKMYFSDNIVDNRYNLIGANQLNNLDLDEKGDVRGYLIFNDNGEVRFALYKNEVCYKKDFASEEIIQSTSIEENDCNLFEPETNFEVELYDYNDDSVNDGYKIIAYNGTNKFLFIPPTINGQPVIAITLYEEGSGGVVTSNKQAAYTIEYPVNIIEDSSIKYIASFWNEENIEAITLPSTLKEICNDGFSSFRNLKTVVLNDGLEKIGEKAFYNTDLSSIEIPDSINYISESAFHINFKKIIIHGKTADTFDTTPFYGCEDIIEWK